MTFVLNSDTQRPTRLNKQNKAHFPTILFISINLIKMMTQGKPELSYARSNMNFGSALDVDRDQASGTTPAVILQRKDQVTAYYLTVESRSFCPEGVLGSTDVKTKSNRFYPKHLPRPSIAQRCMINEIHESLLLLCVGSA